MATLAQIRKIIESESKEDKISALASLTQTSERDVVRLIISRLDDADIQVRGEAFSALLLNENDITDPLVEALDSESKNIRGYSALVLANRRIKEAAPKIAELCQDQSAMVRSCAVGALGYLRADEEASRIERCLEDSNVEVRKSAIKSAMDLGRPDLLKKRERQETDPEAARLIRSSVNGPGGI